MSNEKERFEILLEDVNGKMELVIEGYKTLNTKMDNKFQEMEKRFKEEIGILTYAQKETTNEVKELKNRQGRLEERQGRLEKNQEKTLEEIKKIQLTLQNHEEKIISIEKAN